MLNFESPTFYENFQETFKGWIGRIIVSMVYLTIF